MHVYVLEKVGGEKLQVLVVISYLCKHCQTLCNKFEQYRIENFTIICFKYSYHKADNNATKDSTNKSGNT